jgi:hypothetical protein
MAALWAVAIRDGEPAAEPVRIKDGMQGVYPVLGWTTSGLGYSQYQQTDDIHLVPVDPTSGEPTGSPRLVPYRRTGQNILPEWSPDGKYLAFVSSSSARAAADRRVVLLPSGGGEPREFPAPVERLWALRWFGDSRGLGITGEDATAERLLFRLTLATGEWKTFPLPQTLRSLQWNGMYIDWNADGSRYFYAWQDAFAATDLTIVERDLQSDRERIVYRGKPADNIDRYRGLRFSPDRRLLSFTSREGIRVLDVATGQARLLPDDVAGGTRTGGSRAEVPTWSHNGRTLVFNRTDNADAEKQSTELRLISVDGKEVRRIPLGPQLTRLLSSSRGGPAPAIQSVVLSPDGTRLAIALRASRVDSWIIENPLALDDAPGASARR